MSVNLPAISYYDSSNGDLKFIRATDPSGTSWSAAQTVDSAESVGSNTSIAIVNGNPAISYRDNASQDLKFIRANDRYGNSWPAFGQTIDSPGDVGFNTSLAVVNGKPAISYYDQTNGDLKFIRANDASGTSWGTGQTLDSGGSVGTYTSLAVVNGNPAISYYDITNFDLKFIRANDASGTSWGTGQTLDSGGSVGTYTSLAVVNGNPAISYRDGTNFDLKFIRANDASGTSWGVGQTLDSSGIVGWDTSLNNLAVNPPILYFASLADALSNISALGATDYGNYAVGSTIYGSNGGYTSWRIAPNSSGSSSQLQFYSNSDTLNSDGNTAYYFLYQQPPCFLEGTKVLCLIGGQEKYVEIQNLRKGDLVKTRLNGYKKLELLGSGKIRNLGTPDRIQDRLYLLSKEKYPELTEDLFITGCHSLLVENITEEERQETLRQLGDIFITDRRYRLMACIDERAEPWISEGEYTIWHFALENEDSGMNYGIYANGKLLVETCSLRTLKKRMDMKFLET